MKDKDPTLHWKGEMAGKFSYKKFSDLNVDDPFFDSLKADYPGSVHSTGFVDWFSKKSQNDTNRALVFNDEIGLGAFVYLKEENESVKLLEGELPARPRKKIGTFVLAERYRGQRLGEGALGIALWIWQREKIQEIYVTVFEKHTQLIELLRKFGFEKIGENLNGELVYLKDRAAIDYSNPYKSFPFIDPNFQNAGYLIIDDKYHDTLFPYSELRTGMRKQVAIAAANGLTKIYIGSPLEVYPYRRNEPVLIYRKYTGQDGNKGFKSCVTSYGVVNNIIVVKKNGDIRMSFEEACRCIGNKSIFDNENIRSYYQNRKNLVIVELLYFGFFGSGNNVNWHWLKDNELWPDQYPTTARLTQENFKTIINEGGIDVSNVIVD